MEIIYHRVLVNNFIFIDKVVTRRPQRNLPPCKSLWPIVPYRVETQDVMTVMQQY